VELTIESAFSVGGLVGHLAYLLLVMSMCMRSMFWLRILVIASALVAISYAAIWLNDPVSTMWESLLVAVNVIQITREWMSERRAKFRPEEEAFVQRRLSGLSRAEARRLLDMGLWVDAETGTTLTTEGTPVQHVAYVTSGAVEVTLDGRCVGVCGPGNFVGEMSVLANTPASATAIVKEPTRYWLIPAAQLRALKEKEPALADAFQTGIARDLRNKIISGNTARATPSA
jgi:CRP-like cAMP-binding protein